VKSGKARRHFAKREEKRGGDRRKVESHIGENPLSEKSVGENSYQGHDPMEDTLIYGTSPPEVSTGT